MSLAQIFSSVAGQESADLDETTIVATAEEAAEAVVEAEIAEANADIAEQEKDIAQLETAIEAVEEKVEELEEHVDGLESMISGATPFNAGLFAHQYAQASKIAAKFGVPTEVKGAESFADASTANLNAYAGIEAFKDTALKAAGAVKKFFVDLYNSFINLFVGLFNKLKGIKNSAMVTKAAVNKAEKTKDEVTLPKSANLLNAGGGSEAIASLVAVGGKVYSELQDLGMAMDGDSANAVHAVASTFAGIGSKTIENKTETTETLVVKLGVGGEVRITAPTKDAGISKTTVSVKAGETAPTGSKMEKSALINLLNSVASNADKLQNAKLDKSALNQQRDKAIAVMEKNAKNSAPAADDKDGRKAAGAEKKLATAAIKSAHNAGLKLGRAATSLGADILGAQIAFVKAHF